MSIYHTVDDHLDGYIESLGGERSTLDDAVRWVSRELYHRDETIRLLSALTIHQLALDRAALAQEQGESMTTKTDGGAAFPVADHPSLSVDPGMTLRDYFAAKALPMCMTADESAKTVAEMAYSMADAMLAAREKKS